MLDYLYGSIGTCLLKMELNGVDFQLDLAKAAQAYGLCHLLTECRLMLEEGIRTSMDDCLKIHAAVRVIGGASVCESGTTRPRIQASELNDGGGAELEAKCEEYMLARLPSLVTTTGRRQQAMDEHIKEALKRRFIQAFTYSSRL